MSMNKAEVTALINNKVIAENEVSVEWNGTSIKIKKLIDTAIANAVIASISEGAFYDDGEYNPSNIEFMIRMFVVTMYTDIEMPDEKELQYALVYGTDIYSVVLDNICSDQLFDIITNIEKCVEFKKQMNVDGLRARMQELQAEVSTILEQIGSLLGQVSADDIRKLVDAISNSKLDEKKLVDALVEKDK